MPTSRPSKVSRERASRSKDTPTLPTKRAFVVQLRWDAVVGRGDFRGRVEHFTSGEATRFESAKELLSFITRVVTTQREEDE